MQMANYGMNGMDSKSETRLDKDKQTVEDGEVQQKWGPIKQKYWNRNKQQAKINTKEKLRAPGYIVNIYTPNTYTDICAWLSWSGRKTRIPLGAAIMFEDLKDLWG